MALELVISSQLFGVVESVAVLRSRVPGQKATLMLTFRHAQLLSHSLLAFPAVVSACCGNY